MRAFGSGILPLYRKAIAEHKTAPMFVIHGGTMMAILSQVDSEGRSFYDFHVANGEDFAS